MNQTMEIIGLLRSTLNLKVCFCFFARHISILIFIYRNKYFDSWRMFRYLANNISIFWYYRIIHHTSTSYRYSWSSVVQRKWALLFTGTCNQWTSWRSSDGNYSKSSYLSYALRQLLSWYYWTMFKTTIIETFWLNRMDHISYLKSHFSKHKIGTTYHCHFWNYVVTWITGTNFINFFIASSRNLCWWFQRQL